MRRLAVPAATKVRARRKFASASSSIVNEVPIQQYYPLPYHRWEAYADEREQLLQFLRNMKDVVFLTTTRTRIS